MSYKVLCEDGGEPLNKTLRYVYEHRDEYKAILELLKEKSETIPGLGDAIHSIEKMLSHCAWYEHWRIDSDCYAFSLFKYDEVRAYLVTRIPNQSTRSGEINPNEDMLVIWHDTGPYIFGDDYPIDFFVKFYGEVKAACPPDYEDEMNHALYYKRTRAAYAYMSYCEIRAKYHKMNVERKKKLRIKKLEEELAEAKEEAK